MIRLYLFLGTVWVLLGKSLSYALLITRAASLEAVGVMKWRNLTARIVEIRCSIPLFFSFVGSKYRCRRLTSYSGEADPGDFFILTVHISLLIFTLKLFIRDAIFSRYLILSRMFPAVGGGAPLMTGFDRRTDSNRALGLPLEKTDRLP